MNDVEELNEQIILTDDDMRDLRDVRAALLKQRHGQVDVDAVWETFVRDNSTTDSESPQQPKRARYVVMGALMGIAASLLCFLLLRPLLLPQASENNNLLVSEYIEQLPETEMTTVAQSPGQGKTAKQEPRKEKIAGEAVLDFTKLAANGVIEERTVTTPRGKVQTIILADGTRVLLNNESSLRFPTRFTGDTRTVWVEGEAYFTVAKDPQHPFIVKSRDIQTTALGTRFNVKAFKDKSIHITLVDGSVKVTDSQGKEIILKPGEDACTVNDKLVIGDADVKTYLQWEEGYFYYDNVPLIDVLVELGRWYNVNIELKNRRLMSYRLHFIADRNAGIDDAIERLNEFGYLHAERQGGKIVVSDKNIQP